MKSHSPHLEQALGSDPFTQGDGTLPFLIRLREHTIRLVDESGQPRSRSAPPGKLAEASTAAMVE